MASCIRAEVSETPSRCSSCAEPVPPQARFCPACGAAMDVSTSITTLRAAGWTGVGVLMAIDLLMVISIPPVLLVTLPLTVLAFRALERWPGPDPARWWMALGMAALPFFFAYTNRHGPGTYCHSIGTPRYPGTECADGLWDPRPFAAAGIALVLAAVLAPALSHRRRAGDRT
jgi:zinc ribbon protein